MSLLIRERKCVLLVKVELNFPILPLKEFQSLQFLNDLNFKHVIKPILGGLGKIACLSS